MIVNIFMHAMEQGLAKEACTCEDIKKFIGEIGWERIDKVVLTDFRPIVRTLADGKKEVLCPDF